MQLPALVIAALADGELDAAQRELAAASERNALTAATGWLTGGDAAGAALTLTPYLVSPESQRTWRVRAEQIAARPEAAAWITRAVHDPDRRLVVGKAGYHGPPDDGLVEIGYSIDPAVRRRGYARAAVEAMLEHARSSPGIHTVRASISPDNHRSLGLIAQFGFVAVGEQIDEEDGLEIVYEVAV